MITFTIENKKNVGIYNNNELFMNINLITSTVTNKFNIITEFIENISKNIEGFDEWFISFLSEYSRSDNRFKILEDNIENIKKFADKYIDFINIDLSKFVDETKAKKNSILFLEDEIEKIIRFSSYLKIYSFISNCEDFMLDKRSNKIIYNLIASDITKDLTYKIFNIVKTKTYRYNQTDKYMWDYIKMVQCKTIDLHVIHIFNFIMNNIIVLCNEDRNPIIYFVTVIDESVRWFLRSIYKSSVIYDDSVSTEDIQSVNVDNLRTYCYNDTLGRLKGIAYDKIHTQLEPIPITFEENENKNDSEKFVVQLQQRLEKVKHISPFCNFLVYPILSKVTGIPYNHMKTLPPDHAIILSLYIQKLLFKVFGDKYHSIFNILSYYPREKVHQVSTSYKLKNLEFFINLSDQYKNFLGFNSKILLANMLANFIGKTTRIKFTDILNGKKLDGIPLSKIEVDIIEFFVLFFSGKLDHYFEKMKKLIENEF